MNLSDYFNPPTVVSKPCLIQDEHTLSHHLVPFQKEKINADVALIGVCEAGNSLYNKGAAQAPDEIRSYLYNLHGRFNNLYLADLGNLKQGNGLNDTYFALQDVVAYLLSERVIPIVMGGSHDLTFSVAKAVSEKIPGCQVAIGDSALDALSKEELHDHAFIHQVAKMAEHISVFGIQGYQSEKVDDVETLRLKTIREDLYVCEPILRDAHFTSFDISIVRASDAPGCGYASPNGLYAEQFCKLAHYAGLSDTVKAFGMFGVNPQNDINGVTAQLAAQTIWHFVNGLDNRFKDFPLRDIKTYQKKLVYQEDLKLDLVFYHNIQNNRYWFNAATEEEPVIVSCTLEDYLQACDGQLPDRLMRYLR